MDLQIELVISQIIAFLILLWVLKRYAWKPLLNALEDRQNKIKKEFNSIEEQKMKLNGLIKEYNEKMADIQAVGKVKFQEELAKANKASLEITEQAHKEAKDIIFKAQEDALGEIQKAKIQLKDELVDLIMASTEKMIQKNLDDPDKQKILIEKFIEQGVAK